MAEWQRLLVSAVVGAVRKRVGDRGVQDAIRREVEGLVAVGEVIDGGGDALPTGAASSRRSPAT